MVHSLVVGKPPNVDKKLKLGLVAFVSLIEVENHICTFAAKAEKFIFVTKIRMSDFQYTQGKNMIHRKGSG